MDPSARPGIGTNPAIPLLQPEEAARRRRGLRLLAGAVAALLLGVTMAGSTADSSDAAPVNDPEYHDQWGLQRVGAPYAWSRSTGQGVLIAVVDTGVDLTHPDLAKNLVPGKDFVDGDDLPRDESGHGTLVAGIAAAVSGNGIGIASVAPGAQILPVRVLGSAGTGSPAATAAGIRWAVDTARARGKQLVVNLSLDWDSAPFVKDLPDLIGDVAPNGFVQDPTIDAAIRDAAEAGAVVVVAAGNEDLGHTPYDSATPGVLVVGASDRGDGRTSFSTTSQGLDLLAPGVDVLSTYWMAQTGSTYATARGTSVAAPFVSGTAALLMATGRSNAEAEAAILDTARDLGAPGWDPETGRGLLDTAAALGAPRTGSPGLPGQPVTAAATRPSPSPQGTSPVARPSSDSPPVNPRTSETPSPSPVVHTPFTVALEPLRRLEIPAAEPPPPWHTVAVAAAMAFVSLLALTASRRCLRAATTARTILRNDGPHRPASGRGRRSRRERPR